MQQLIRALVTQRDKASHYGYLYIFDAKSKDYIEIVDGNIVKAIITIISKNQNDTATHVNAGGQPYVRSSTKYYSTGRKLQVGGAYTGISYDPNTYTVSVSGGGRTMMGGFWVPGSWGPEYCYSTSSAVHTIYMTKFPMI